MSNYLQRTGIPEFSSGEAEELVKQIRQTFRTAEAKREVGDRSGAARTERSAQDMLEKIRQRLEHFLDRQIQRQIAFASMGEKEDAIAELESKVLLSIKDTQTSLSAAHWERRFNQCVLRRTLDICRPIQKRYGYGATSDLEPNDLPVRGPREINFSALDKINNTEGSESHFVDRLPDTKAERAIEAVLGSETLHQLISQLGPKDRNNLVLWWRQANGETWETIGISEDLLPDTVRKRAQAVIQVLRKVAGA